MRNTLLDAALAYRNRGWSVIPIRSHGDREPLVKWRTYQERLPTEDEIREWWTIHPKANIALITGQVSGVVAIDIDPRNGGDVEKVWAEAPTGLASRSGGGGAHLFFKHPGGVVPCSDSKGVEIKGDGGNITLPPSIHASGRRYQWVIEGKLAALPKALVHVNGNGTNGKVKSEPWLTRSLIGVPDGERNKIAARIAGYYIGKGLPDDVIISTMCAWDTKNDPPLSRDVIESTVKSVRRTHERRSSGFPIQQVTRVASSVEEAFGLVDFNAYMTQYGDMSVEWAVQDWMPDKTIAMAVAPPGSYKTWLELALAISIASGKPFLGRYDILRPGPVIIVQQEDYHGQMAERLAVIAGSMFSYGASADARGYNVDAPPTLPIYLHPDRRFRFGDKVVMQSLEEKVAEIEPVAVIIDPLYSTGSMDDFGVELVDQMWPMKTMRDKYGCSFFIAHHTAKHKEETGREDLWGNQFLNAFIETGWQIRQKNEPDTAIVRRHFKVRRNIEEEVIKFDISTEPPYKFDVSIRAASSKDLEAPDLLGLLSRHGPMNQAEMTRRTGHDKSTISRYMRNLEKAGLVYRDTENMYTPAREQIVGG